MSINLVKIILHKHTWRLISQVVLEFIKTPGVIKKYLSQIRILATMRDLQMAAASIPNSI